jgi:hypothetical protein
VKESTKTRRRRVNVPDGNVNEKIEGMEGNRKRRRRRMVGSWG